MHLFFMILEIIISVCLIATILLQSGKSAGLSGAIAGGAEMFFGKKKGMDEFLSKLSIGFATAFFVLTMIMAVLF